MMLDLLGIAKAKEEHDSVFTSTCSSLLVSRGTTFPHLASLQKQVGQFLNMDSCLVRAAVVVLAAAQDDTLFSAVTAKTNLEAAGAVGDHRWHLMLPTSSRVSPVTYAAVVATRYERLC